MHPLIKGGTIIFNRLHQTLLDQLRYFPKGKYDDGPDALQMAVEDAQPASIEFSYGFAGGPSCAEIPEWLISEYEWEEISRVTGCL